MPYSSVTFTSAGTYAVSAVLDAISLVWIELTMLALAAIVYAVFTGGVQTGNLTQWISRKAIPGGSMKASSSTSIEQELRRSAARGDHNSVLVLWQQMKRLTRPMNVCFSNIVDAMLKTGSSTEQVMEELRQSVESNLSLLKSLGNLPSALLRDDNLELAIHATNLLQEFEHTLDISVYATLMSAQLRRQDYAGIVKTAAGLSDDMLTSRLRSMIATALVHSGKLDDALEQICKIPVPGEGARCGLSMLTVSQLLSLAVQEQRAPAALEELQRLRARPDMKTIENLALNSDRSAELMKVAAALVGRRPVGSGPASLPTNASGAQRAAAAIRACARDKDLAGAHDAFTHARSTMGQPSSLLFNSFLDACVQCGDAIRAKEHFNEMRQLNIVDVVAYNMLLKLHLSSGELHNAKALMKEMNCRGVQANKVTYNELLHARVVANDIAGVWAVVEEMKTAGVPANQVTCSILMKSLNPHSHPNDVKRILELIDQVEEPIDEVLITSVIEACIRSQQLDALSDFLVRYKTKVSVVQLSAPAYGSMIKAYGQAGDIGRVLELWDEMESRGVQPTSITLGCMAEALVVNNCAQEAWDLVHRQLESEEQRGFVNTVIYSTILKGFASTRSVEKVFAVYTEMREKGIPCNTITYNTLLDACAKSSSMSRASTLLEDMKTTSVEPDIITYSTIIKGYCLEGDLDRAFSILSEMKNDGKFSPDEIMYNSLLDGCAKQHRVDDALKVLEDMKAAEVNPSNYTLSILVKLLGHARRLNQAFTMVEDLSKKHGFRPNVQVYTCLMQACIFNRRLERAINLHDVMAAESTCKVDQKLYTVLVRGCLQLQKPMKATEVVRAAYHLPGHNLAEPARKPPRPVGVEAHALEELFSRLRSGSPEERNACTQLEAEIKTVGGVAVSHHGKGRGRFHY